MPNTTPVAIVLSLGLFALAPAAQAAEPVEGTWNFGGGEVLVKPTGPGTFEGTVVKQTQFSTCPHLAGERMWKLSGSGANYTGTHNYLSNDDCSIQETPGQASWRIISTDPSRLQLEHCSSPPGEGEPTPENPETRCHTLDRLRPPEPPVTPAVEREVLRDLPKAKRCQSRRKFRIRVRQLEDVTYRQVSVNVNGRATKVRRAGGRHVATVDLRRLPKGRFKVKIAVVTAEGQTIRATRKYRTCSKRRRSGSPGRL